MRKGIANSKHARIFETVAAIALLSLWSAAWVWFFYRGGYLTYYGDAEAHLNIARRILDSRTPGYDELGSVWLPLPHVLTMIFARNDALWRSGLAGSIVSACSFILAGAFLFGAARRVFDTRTAVAAAVLFAANPNVLYLQSTAMTEPLFMASLMAILYFTVLFRDTQSWPAICGAGIAAICGTLTRYEAWFVVPFVALFVLVTAQRQRVVKAALFSGLACLGPLYWFGHNWWCCSNVLDFYNGPYSPAAIQASHYYPGLHNWAKAWLYFRTAARWCAGAPLLWLGGAGLLVSLVVRQARWPALLLLLPGVFYVWSMHSSGGTPMFLPDLWPNSYYNSRYGLAVLPALVFGAAALVWLVPARARGWPVVAVTLAASIPWLIHPRPDAWITWKESQVNSEARRQWTREAAQYLAPRYQPGTGIITTFGDVTGIFRAAGIPLRETLTWDNWPHWPAAVARPDLFLWEEWAVVMGGDPVQSALLRAGAHGPRYELVKIIAVPHAPVVEIYHCCIGLTPLDRDANSFHESARSEKRLPADEER
ncbi:MAG: ArnT family glycosyltransferase [Bryobacteraceae bacterium]